MIFVDSNVPMYLVGAPHPHKHDARRMLEGLVSEGETLATDAEVFQEILHRYTAIGRRDAIQPAFDALSRLVDQVFSVDGEAVDAAKELVLGHLDLSARDAIHAAIMQQHGLDTILSFDRDFDRLPGITRLSR